MSKEDLIRFIQIEIQKKYGQEVLRARDCKHLSKSIFKYTKRQISVTTIKRFFGIVQSPFRPSKYTLDTIAIYIDYKSWNNLLNDFEERAAQTEGTDVWSQLRARIQMITEISMTSLFSRLGDQYKDFATRSFAVKRFDAFLNSPQKATALIAPGGYGKSTLVTQLTEMFFTGPDAKYSNDIVCLVDGNVFNELLKLNTELFKIQNLLDFDLSKSFSLYFRENPNEVKGRFVLIIDGIYSIYYQAGKLNAFVQNLMDILASYKDIPWFKMLVTSRPDNWKLFSTIVQKHPHLKDLWYDVNFESTIADNINIPPLQNSEIKSFLEKRASKLSFESLKFHYPEIKNILRNPYMLQLFEAKEDVKEFNTDIELLNQFVKEKVYFGPYLGEKSKIIENYFTLSENARQNTIVKKEDLKIEGTYTKAYDELLADNILYEFSVMGSHLSVNTYVKFSHEILKEFLLANKWLKENEFTLELLKKIYAFYSDNEPLQISILKHLIKFAFKENNTGVLKDVFLLFEDEVKKNNSDCIARISSEIVSIIGVELRNRKDLRALLIPHYAKTELGQRFYFESFFDMDSLVLFTGDYVNLYLENKKNRNAQVRGHFLKFMQYFLAGDHSLCQEHYEIMHRIDIDDEICPREAGYYFAVLIIYQNIFKGALDAGLIMKIHHWSDRFFEASEHANNHLPLFDHVVLYALNYGENFDQVIEYMSDTIQKYKLEPRGASWQNKLAFLVFARALLNKGRVDEAFGIYHQLELKTVPVNIQLYVGLRYNIITLEFLIHLKKYKKAKRLVNEIKKISKMIRQKYFYDLALMYEKTIGKG